MSALMTDISLLLQRFCLRHSCPAQRARLWRSVGKPAFHCIAHRNPSAFDAGHRSSYHNETALLVGLDHLDIERRHALGAQMAGHLLVLENLARILAVSGRADAPMADGHAVRSAQTAEIPAFHAARKAFADRGPSDVDILAGNEMVDGDLGSDLDQIVLAHAKF